MRVIERLLTYLDHRRLTPYTFERACNIGNGYLKKQEKGKGTIGSETLQKIGSIYKDLNLSWLLTGAGNMIIEGSYPGGIATGNWSEGERAYSSQEHTIKELKDRILFLENTLADKEKIIGLLERIKAEQQQQIS
jgi:hypothetical protein